MKRMFLISILPILIVGIIIFYFKDNGKSNNSKIQKEAMLFDAETLIGNAELQHILEEDSSYTKCYYIYGIDNGIYENANNYIGSILTDGKKSTIWLSDGKYMVQGTNENLIILETNEIATTKCNGH